MKPWKNKFNKIHKATEIIINLCKIHLQANPVNFLSLGMHYCTAATKFTLNFQ